MGRKKNEIGGCGFAVVGFFLLILSGPLAPIIAFALGIAGLIYVVRRLARPAPTVPATASRHVLTAQHHYQISQFGNEVHALQKMMSKPAKRWQTHIDRIREASAVKARIERAASNAGSAASAFNALSVSLTNTINAVAAHCTPALNRHFLEQTEKLNAITAPARAAKAGQSLLEQLDDIAAIDGSLYNIAHTLAHPIRERATSASQANTLKVRLAAAKVAERDGKRDAALSEYLTLLYEMKTDSINDSEQANEIADLEDRVRKVVRSYANLHRRGKTN